VTNRNTPQGNILLIGAHPDDIVIGAFSALNRYPHKVIMFTATNGAIANIDSYPTRQMPSLHTPEAYAKQRSSEEREICRSLGIPEERVFLGNIPDQEAIWHIPQIVTTIEQLISQYEPTTIITHSFPQAHPDHEVVCYATHRAVKNVNYTAPILEYPMYTLSASGDRQEFVFFQKGPIIQIELSVEEQERRSQELKKYTSQGNVHERYFIEMERFLVHSTPRIWDNFSHTGYIPAVAKNVTPTQVWEAITAHEQSRKGREDTYES